MNQRSARLLAVAPLSSILLGASLPSRAPI